MQRDPYDILGIGPLATDDEIKKAYRELAKKYHPDNFTDDNMRALAEEKMKEINEAYEYVRSHSQSAQTGEYQSSGNIYTNVRILINQGRYQEADMILDGISESTRSAEWNFLKGCIMTNKGWFMDADRYFALACELDPTNTEYRHAYDSLKQNTQTYSRGYRQVGENGRQCNITCCDLLCAECMCELCCEGLCEGLSGC